MRTTAVVVFLISLALLLAACIPAPTAPPPTATPLPTFTPTATVTPTPLPPETRTALELIASQQAPVTLSDGQMVIDLYVSPGKEHIRLQPESVKITVTHDGLNPEILSAESPEGDLYAFNPEHGWFEVPQIQTDYRDLAAYTPVSQAFFEDGRANIAQALLYAANPTIPPDAVPTQWWANYSSFQNLLCFSFVPAFNFAEAALDWPEYWPRDRAAPSDPYDRRNIGDGEFADIRPFGFTGFYRVLLGNGETVYVMAPTVGNPTEANPEQLINLFLGFDRAAYEEMANRAGTNLDFYFHTINEEGSKIFSIILIPPPTKLPDGSWAATYPYPNLERAGPSSGPTTLSLYPEGALIELFPPTDQELILKVFTTADRRPGYGATAPLPSLPPALAKFILPTLFSDY